MFKAQNPFHSRILKCLASGRPIFKWLISDPLKKSKRDITKIMLLQAASMISQILGFIIVIRLTGLLLNGWTMQVLGSAHDLEKYKLIIFWGVLAASFILLFSGSAFAFRARKITAKLARITEERVLLKVTRSFIRSIHWGGRDQNTAFPPDPATLKSFYSRGGRFAGRMVMAVTSALVPFLFMCISLAAMTWLKPILTTGLLIILVLAAPVFLRVARKGSRAASDLLLHARNSTLDRNSHLDNLRLSMHPPTFSKSRDSYRINETQATREFMDAYERRLWITALSTFFSQAAIALMLVTILLAAVYPAVQGQKIAVQPTLYYIAAFKFFGSGLIATINAFVTLNVFYSYCREMVPFLEQTTGCNDDRPRETVREENVPTRDLVPGRPVAVNLHIDIDWTTIPLLVSSLENHFSGEHSLCTEQIRLINLQTPVVEELDTATEAHMREIVSELHETAKGNKKLTKQMRYVHPENLSRKKWNKTPPEIKLLAQGLTLKKEACALTVFIQGTDFINTPPEAREKMLGLLEGHYIFIVFPGELKYKHIPENLFDTLVCVSPEGVGWIGDFSTAGREGITVGDFYKQEDSGFSENEELLEEI